MSNKADQKAKAKPARLGRGLDALLSDTRRRDAKPADDDNAVSSASVGTLAVGRLSPHPDQPRKYFDEDAIEELAANIKERGIIQPIVVRPLGNDEFQIVAGERRWRAAQRAKLHEVPVIIRDFSESETLEIALIENIQREDLNPLEEAEAYKRLIERFGHSQAALARLVDKSRSHIANLMRLLNLPEAIRTLLQEGSIEMGHARALIGFEGAEDIANRIAREKLTVRDVEAIVRKSRDDQGPIETKSAKPGQGGRGGSEKHPDIVALENQLSDQLGLKLMVKHDNKNATGEITIRYSSMEQLDMICQRISGEEF